MTSGLGGIGYGEDAVAAKLSLDLPQDSEEILKHIAQFSGEVQTNMEATSRYTGTYLEYLKSFPTIQNAVNDLQREQLQILRDTQSAMDRLQQTGSAGFMQTGLPGQQYSDAGRSLGPMGYFGPGGQRLPPGYERHIPGSYADPNYRQPENNDQGRQHQAPDRALQEEIDRQNRVANRVDQRTAGAPIPPTISEADLGNLPALFEPFFQGLFEGLKKYLDEQDSGNTGDPNKISENADVRGDERAAEIERNRRGRHRRDEDPDEPDDDSDDTVIVAGVRRRRRARPEPGESRADFQRRIQAGGQGAAGALNDATRLIAPGGSNASRLSALSRLLGRTGDPDDPDDNGSGGAGLLGRLNGLPGWAKGLGIAGGVIAGGSLINGAVQNTGEAIMGLRNEDLRGHSLAGGLGVESDIRLMALNPLITNEQSREIIMGALKGGYKGETYDSAVDFVKKNLIDMNMEVGKSFELLKNNVMLGGQSQSSLNYDLATTQALAQAGPKTTDQLQSDFLAVNNALTGAGVNAEAASDAASFGGAFFNTVGADGQPNPIGIAGTDGTSVWTKIVTTLTGENNPFKSRINNRFTPNTPISNTWNVVGNKANQYILQLLQEDARQLDFTAFGYKMQGYGVDGATGGRESNTMRSLYEQLKNTKNDIKGDAEKQFKDTNTMKVAGQDAVNLPTFDQWKAEPGHEDGTLSQYNLDISGGQSEAMPTVDSDVLRRIIKADTDHKLVIVDDKGKAHLLDPEDQQQVIGLSNGSWKIVDSGKTMDAARNDDGSLKNTTGAGNFTQQTQNKDLRSQLKDLDLSGKAAIASGDGWSVANLQTSDSGNSKVGNQFNNEGQGANRQAIGAGGTWGDNSGGGSVDMSGAAPFSQLNPEQQRYLLDIAPGAMQFFIKGYAPGNTPTDPNTIQSNSGENGASKNGKPGG